MDSKRAINPNLKREYFLLILTGLHPVSIRSPIREMVSGSAMYQHSGQERQNRLFSQSDSLFLQSQ
jgi:hypothetical protein